jgi:hypothetical protein
MAQKPIRTVIINQRALRFSGGQPVRDAQAAHSKSDAVGGAPGHWEL